MENYPDYKYRPRRKNKKNRSDGPAGSINASPYHPNFSRSGLPFTTTAFPSRAKLHFSPPQRPSQRVHDPNDHENSNSSDSSAANSPVVNEHPFMFGQYQQQQATYYPGSYPSPPTSTDSGCVSEDYATEYSYRPATGEENYFIQTENEVVDIRSEENGDSYMQSYEQYQYPIHYYYGNNFPVYHTTAFARHMYPDTELATIISNDDLVQVKGEELEQYMGHPSYSSAHCPEDGTAYSYQTQYVITHSQNLQDAISAASSLINNAIGEDEQAHGSA